MAAPDDDEEQIEAIKNWLNQNGTSLAVGIVLAVGAVVGYQSWENSQRESGESASQIYEELVQAVEVNVTGSLSDEKKSTGRYLAGQLKSDYENTTYAVFAALHIARVAVDDGDWEAAEEELRWALAHSDEPSLTLICQQRLARILLQQDETDEALALVENVDAGAQLASFEEVKGDIYRHLGRTADARRAYQKAVDSQVEGVAKPILLMKLEDLGEADVVSESDSEAS